MKKPFKYKGRIYRIVCKGLTLYRLQDNKGNTYLVYEDELMKMKYNL